jgi:hypothetical protein
MRPDEALPLKCVDRATAGRARFSPRTAIRDPAAGPDTPPRESIEVRELVLHPA